MLAHKLRRRSVFQMTFIGWSSTANDATITPHANAAVGDLAVFFQRSQQDTTAPTAAVPAGYTEVAADNEVVGSVGNRTSVAYRVLTVLTAITGMDASKDVKIMAVFRPIGGTIGTVTPSTWLLESTSGSDQSNQTVSMAGQTGPILGFGMASKRAGTNVSITGTPSLDSSEFIAADAVLMMFAGFKRYNDSPADVAMDYLNANNSDLLTSGYLKVAKA
jgi:hypothetical protein